MRKGTRAIVVLWAALSACDARQPIAKQVPGELPLAHLDSIWFGMRTKAFRIQRPNARVAPYIGYQESIGDYNVLYAFWPAARAENTQPGSLAELYEVSAARDLRSDAAAESAWHALVASLTRKGNHVNCFELRDDNGGSAGGIAVEKRGDNEIAAEYHRAYSIPSIGRDWHVPAGVTVTFGPGRERQGADPIPCPGV